MPSESDSLSNAVKKAATEIQRASIAVIKGEQPSQAFAEKVHHGPEDVLTELQEIFRSPTINSSYLMLSFGGLSERWIVSKSGNLIIPVVDDKVASLVKLDSVGEDENERRKNRERIAKSGQQSEKFAQALTKLQNGVVVPKGLTPYFIKALTPTPSILSALPVLVTVCTLAWLKRFGRKV